MSLSTYASIRSTTPGVSIAAAGGGSLTAGSAWFWVQARNRVGKNLPTALGELTWADGQKIQITIASTARASGEEIFEYVISSAATNDPTQMRKLFAWRAKNTLTVGSVDYPGQGTDKSLPVTLEIAEDSQLILAGTVANSASLPASNLLYGQVRQIVATSEYVMYDDLATSGAYAASSGYWVLVTQTELETYLSATTGLGGCDRPLILLNSGSVFYKPPAYAGDGSDSSPVRFWYSNDLDETTGPIESQGLALTLQLLRNAEDLSDLFSGKVVVSLVGYVRRSTGVLDTTVPTVGNTIVWNASTSLIELPQDLDRGYAACYEINFRFRRSELGNRVPGGSQLTLDIYPSATLGTPDSAWYITGDVVLSDSDLLRIVPDASGVKQLAGRCLVGGYRSPSVGVGYLTGLVADTDGQKVCISAALAGEMVLRQSADALLDTEAIRAIISTSPGTTTPNSYSSDVAISGTSQSLQVAITHPTTVRSDYPDVLAGQTVDFTAPEVYVYVLFSSVIYRFDYTVTAPSQSVLITDLSAGTIVGSLPTSPSDDFCLYGYGTVTPTAVTSPSSLAAGNYQVCIAYNYPTGNTQVTAITHSALNGCIPELIPLQDAIAAASQIYTGSATPSNALGSENDIYLKINSPVMDVYKKGVSSWTLEQTITAPTGPAGPNGVDSYTTTTATFTQPSIGSDVSVSVAYGGWAAVGQTVYISSGGYYTVTTGGSTTLVLNLVVPVATVGSTVSSGETVSPSGINGTDGTDGADGIDAFTFSTASFTQPAVGSSVSVGVVSGTWAAVGQYVYVQSAGYYTVSSASSTSLTLTLQSAIASVGATVATGRQVSPAGITGTSGTIGDAYTTLAASFTQPAIGGTVTITLSDNSWLSQGSYIRVQTAGVYQLYNIPGTGGTVDVSLISNSGGVAVGSTVSSGRPVVAAGAPGTDGLTGIEIRGLELVYSTSSSFSVSAGSAAIIDASNNRYLATTSGFSVSMSSTWNGTTTNGKVSGSTSFGANQTWHVFICRNQSSTNQITIAVDDNTSGSNISAGFDFRMIGSLMTDSSGNFRQWKQVGDRFIWDTPIQDSYASLSTTSSNTITLPVPSGLKLRALGSMRWTASSTVSLFSGSPQASSAYLFGTVTSGNYTLSFFDFVTNTSAGVRAYGSGSGGTLVVNTSGYIHPRGRFT
jgi:hypothetical protein